MGLAFSLDHPLLPEGSTGVHWPNWPLGLHIGTLGRGCAKFHGHRVRLTHFSQKVGCHIHPACCPPTPPPQMWPPPRWVAGDKGAGSSDSHSPPDKSGAHQGPRGITPVSFLRPQGLGGVWPPSPSLPPLQTMTFQVLCGCTRPTPLPPMTNQVISMGSPVPQVLGCARRGQKLSPLTP